MVLIVALCLSTPISTETKEFNVEAKDVENEMLITKDIDTRVSNVIYKSEPVTQSYEVPTLDTTFKAYMDFRFLTNRESKQWKIQQDAYTDKNGLRKIEDKYCVAMGTYYAEECGDTFSVKLEDEIEFKVIVSDIKSPKHTDSENKYTPLSNKKKSVYNDDGIKMVNVIEFIIDEKVMDEKVLDSGCVNVLGFDGNIMSIEKIIE